MLGTKPAPSPKESSHRPFSRRSSPFRRRPLLRVKAGIFSKVNGRTFLLPSSNRSCSNTKQLLLLSRCSTISLKDGGRNYQVRIYPHPSSTYTVACPVLAPAARTCSQSHMPPPYILRRVHVQQDWRACPMMAWFWHRCNQGCSDRQKSSRIQILAMTLADTYLLPQVRCRRRRCRRKDMSAHQLHYQQISLRICSNSVRQLCCDRHVRNTISISRCRIADVALRVSSRNALVAPRLDPQKCHALVPAAATRPIRTGTTSTTCSQLCHSSAPILIRSRCAQDWR